MKYFSHIYFALYLFILTACSDTPNEPQVPSNSLDWLDTLKVSIELYNYKSDFYIGQQFHFQTRFEPLLTKDSIFTPKLINTKWEVSNNSIASIDSNGMCSFTALGKTIIKVNVFDKLGNFITADSIEAICSWENIIDTSVHFTSISFYNQSNRIYATTIGGGIYFSETQGENWEAASYGTNLNNGSILINFDYCYLKPENLLAFTTDYKDKYLNYSLNSGSNWQYNKISSKITSILFNPHDERTLFAISRDRDFYVYSSMDYGVSWELISSFEASFGGSAPTLFIDKTNPANMYIGAHRSFYSSDSGKTWSRIVQNINGGSFSIIYVDQAGNIYATEYNWDNTLRHRLVKSIDNGNTWSILNVEKNSIYSFTIFENESNLLAYRIWDKNYISFSNDQGVTWSKIYMPLLYSNLVNIIVIVNSNPVELLVVSSDGSIWKYKMID
jgi:photosystem II stability/assembly factor-like uncharacterized protein